MSTNAINILNVFQPNAETDDDITPLLSAVAAGSLACLDLLIQVLSLSDPCFSVVVLFCFGPFEVIYQGYFIKF